MNQRWDKQAWGGKQRAARFYCGSCFHHFAQLFNDRCPVCLAPYRAPESIRKPKKGKPKSEAPAPELPVRVRVYRRDGYACVYCGAREDLSLDHVVPRSRGGTGHIDNLQTACRSCNQRKGNAMPGEPGWPDNMRLLIHRVKPGPERLTSAS